MDVFLETGLLDDCAASATHQGSTHKTYTVSEPYIFTAEPSVRSYELFYPKTGACKGAEHLARSTCRTL
jgi:hypothetical protein